MDKDCHKAQSPLLRILVRILYFQSQIFSLIREVRKVFEDTLDSKSLNKDEIKSALVKKGWSKKKVEHIMESYLREKMRKSI